MISLAIFFGSPRRRRLPLRNRNCPLGQGRHSGALMVKVDWVRGHSLHRMRLSERERKTTVPTGHETQFSGRLLSMVDMVPSGQGEHWREAGSEAKVSIGQRRQGDREPVVKKRPGGQGMQRLRSLAGMVPSSQRVHSVALAIMETRCFGQRAQESPETKVPGIHVCWATARGMRKEIRRRRKG